MKLAAAVAWAGRRLWRDCSREAADDVVLDLLCECLVRMGQLYQPRQSAPAMQALAEAPPHIRELVAKVVPLAVPAFREAEAVQTRVLPVGEVPFGTVSASSDPMTTAEEILSAVKWPSDAGPQHSVSGCEDVPAAPMPPKVLWAALDGDDGVGVDEYCCLSEQDWARVEAVSCSSRCTPVVAAVPFRAETPPKETLSVSSSPGLSGHVPPEGVACGLVYEPGECERELRTAVAGEFGSSPSCRRHGVLVDPVGMCVPGEYDSMTDEDLDALLRRGHGRGSSHGGGVPFSFRW